MKSLSIGIVTYRSDLEVFGRLLSSLIDAVGALGSPADVSVDILVVCNDESASVRAELHAYVKQIAHEMPVNARLELIEGHGNVGYGAGQNIALTRSSAECHVVLNPDVVLDRAALVESLRFLNRHEDTVMVVPQGFDGADRYARLAKRSPSLFVLLLRAMSVHATRGLLGRLVGGYTYADKLPSASPEPVELASGCYMFCRRNALEAVGGFDERYFLYFEDYDLSRRIAKYGAIYELPTVRIRHLGGRTAHRGFRRISYFVQSAYIFFQRYGWRIV